MIKDAVILFANSPETDAKLKIHSKKRKIVSLAKECFEESLLNMSKKFSACNYSFLISSSEESLFAYLNVEKHKTIFQKGNSFGKRFYNSINEAFLKGFERITIIGNDITVVPKKTVSKALKFADRGGVTIGPSSNGGFYLFSISKNDFQKIDKQKFISLPYQTKTIFVKLVRLLKDSSLCIKLLEKKKYFNCSNELLVVQQFKKVLNNIRSEITKNIFSLLSNSFIRNIFVVTHSLDYQISFHKAPPLG